MGNGRGDAAGQKRGFKRRLETQHGAEKGPAGQTASAAGPLRAMGAKGAVGKFGRHVPAFAILAALGGRAENEKIGEEGLDLGIPCLGIPCPGSLTSFTGCLRKAARRGKRRRDERGLRRGRPMHKAPCHMREKRQHGQYPGNGMEHLASPLSARRFTALVIALDRYSS